MPYTLLLAAEMEEQKEPFITGAIAKGKNKRFAEGLFDQIEKFAGGREEIQGQLHVPHTAQVCAGLVSPSPRWTSWLCVFLVVGCTLVFVGKWPLGNPK